MHDPLDPTPAAPREPNALTPTTPTPPAKLDAHGFDPNDYDWLPVPRQRRRHNGWSAPLQRQFIEALADTGSVTDAARSVGMTKQAAYALRRAPDAAGFARAWDAAMDQAGKALLDLAFERIIHGEDVPILGRDGQRIGGKRRYSDRLTMFMLRGYFPDRFGPADARGRRTLTQPPEVPPVETALAALEPVVPADPHKLMPPEDLAAFIAADAFDAEEEARCEREETELYGVADEAVPEPPVEQCGDAERHAAWLARHDAQPRVLRKLRASKRKSI